MSGESGTVVRLRPPRSCPICGKQAVADSYPFCSERCRDRDLHRWLSGSYAIPVVESEGDDSLDEDGE